MTETKKKPETEKKSLGRKALRSSEKTSKPREVPDPGALSDDASPAPSEKPAASPSAPRVARSVSDLASNSVQRLPVTKKVHRWKPPRLLDMSNPTHAEELSKLRNDLKISIETEQNHWAMDPISGLTTMMVYVEYTEETIEQIEDTGELARFEKEIDELGF